MLRRSIRSSLGLAAALGLVALTSACYAPATAAPAPTPTVTPVLPYGDGVLTIGTLAPLSGAHPERAAAEVAGVEAAVREINEAGGVSGAMVQVFHRDAGPAAGGIVAASFAELTAHGVDVVIGPSEPAVLSELLPLAAAARIPVLVPASPGGGAPDEEYRFEVGDEVASPGEDLLRRLTMADPTLTDTTGASAAHEAVIVAALATLLAEDDGGESIARAIPAALTGGIACASFAECIDVLSTQDDIAYGAGR